MTGSRDEVLAAHGFDTDRGTFVALRALVENNQRHDASGEATKDQKLFLLHLFV